MAVPALLASSKACAWPRRFGCWPCGMALQLWSIACDTWRKSANCSIGRPAAA